MKWLLSIFDSNGGTNLSLPPIASNDPILTWVWSFITTIQMGQPKDCVDAAKKLGSLARNNHRNKKMIVEEGGIGPLLSFSRKAPPPRTKSLPPLLSTTSPPTKRGCTLSWSRLEFL
jgi:hypothetical protein